MSATSSNERADTARGLTRRRLLVGGLAAGVAGGVLASCTSGSGPGSGNGTAAEPGATGPVTGPTTPPSRRRVVSYGSGRRRRAELFRPESPGPWPVVVLIHGGFWADGYRRDLMTYLANDIVDRGWAAWNIDYHGTGRRRRRRGGGWPGTLTDVAAAVDSLADEPAIDLDRVVTVGHSAGGHLALWVACRPDLPPDAPGASPRVTVGAAVSQAGVADLIGAASENLGRGAARRLLGGSPDEVPERYALASPAERTPIGVPMLLVHGALDDIVPVSQSRTMNQRAADAGDDVALEVIDGAAHFEHLDPAERTWPPVVDFLATQFN